MKKTLILLLGLHTLLFSCQGPAPEDELTPEDKDVFISNYDPEVSFSAFKTFTVPDSVLLISSDAEKPQKKRTRDDVTLLNTIKTEMQKLGYTLVDTSANPDLGIQITKIALSYTGINYSPSYYYDPFYGGYGGYYYPSYYIYQIRKGSVIIDMIDLKAPVANNQLKVVWNGQYVDGLGTLGSIERTIEGVRNLFIQSTYLQQTD